jgi:NADH pyrophosphatase NudC (nudix superfamily)
VQRGNTVEQTLISEILEEIGVKEISNIQKINAVLSNIRIPLKDNPLDVGLILMIFSCNIPKNAKIQLSAEHTEYIWASSSEASEKLSYKYPKELTDKI